MTTPREPLSPEERDLAERLARASGPRQPGPALDARILTAAQAAVRSDPVDAAQPGVGTAPIHAASTGTPATTRARRPNRQRLTLGLGVAASLMLAVTVAWQLRPQRGPQLVYEAAMSPDAAQPAAELIAPPSAPSPLAKRAAESAEVTPSPAPQAPAPMSRSAPLSAPKQSPAAIQPPSPPVQPARSPPPQAPAAERPMQAPARSLASPAMKVEQAHQVDRYTPPAPPSPPAPVPQAAQGEASPVPAIAPGAMPGMALDANAARQPQPLADRPQASAAVSKVRQALRAERDAEPALALAPSPAVQLAPAEQATLLQDSRLPVEQWLQRIRLHRFEGKGELARASLQTFQQAHPDQAIPEDLRPLLP